MSQLGHPTRKDVINRDVTIEDQPEPEDEEKQVSVITKGNILQVIKDKTVKDVLINNQDMVEELRSLLLEIENETQSLSLFEAELVIMDVPFNSSLSTYLIDPVTNIAFIPTKLTDYRGINKVIINTNPPTSEVILEIIPKCQIIVSGDDHGTPKSIRFWSGGSYHLRYGGRSIQLCSNLDRINKITI